MRTVNSSQISAKGNTYELYSVTVAWEPLQRSSVESGVIPSGSEQLSSAWWLRLKEIRVRFPMIRTHGDAFRLPVLKSMPDSQRSCSWLSPPSRDTVWIILSLIFYGYSISCILPPPADAVVQLSGCQARARQAVVTLSFRLIGALFSNLPGECESSRLPSPPPTFWLEFFEDTPPFGGVRCSSTLRQASWPIGWQQMQIVWVRDMDDNSRGQVSFVAWASGVSAYCLIGLRLICSEQKTINNDAARCRRNISTRCKWSS